MKPADDCAGLNVGQLIAVLGQFDPGLPVYMGDDPELVGTAYLAAEGGQSYVQLDAPGES